jgi:hypothetical protein
MPRVCRLALTTILSLIAVADAAGQAPGAGWVVLAVDEYRALRTRALPPAPPPPTPPVAAALSRVEYDLRLDSESAGGRALLTIDVLEDGWTRVPIPSGVMVRNAALDGRPVSLVDGTPPHVLLSRPGRAILALDIVLPIAQAAGAESITVPASAAPVSRTALAVPKTGIDLAVSGGFVAERSEAAASSSFVVYGRPNQPMTLSWKRRIDDRRASQPLRFRSRIVEMVGLAEDVMQVSASVRLEIVQGLAREVVLALPAGLIVNQVSGPTVADWETDAGTLRVSLLEPTTTDAAFVVSGEMRAAREGTLVVPIVRVPASERESGGIAVDVVGAGQIGERSPQGLEPADPSDLAEMVSGRESPSMAAFRMTPLPGTQPRSLSVSVVRYTPQAVLVANIEDARYRVLAAEDGWQLVEARYVVRNNQRSFLKVTLDRDTTVWSASLGRRPIRPGVTSAGEVLLPLEKSRAGEQAPAFLVEIVYLRHAAPWSDRTRARLDLPAVDLPMSRTGVIVHYPPRYRVSLEPGAFRVGVDQGFPGDTLSADEPREAKTAEKDPASTGVQELVDRFKKDAGARPVVGVVPVRVSFPEFGPSIFLAAELIPESQSPTIELAARRVK